jgi:flavodoxin
MKAIVVYDSFFGNTEKIARAIGNSLGKKNEVGMFPVGQADPGKLSGLDLLVVGSPTRGFRQTAAINALFKRIPANGLKGVKVAAFDTRISTNDIKSAIMRFMVNLFGYAARPISVRLKKKGGELIIPPEGFLVDDTEGPLKEGELVRAAKWAKQILTNG